jgi:hypothetical protein
MEVKKVLENYYEIECRDKNGNLKWVEKFTNLVTTEGLNDSLDKHLKGNNYSAAWYLGLTGATPIFAAADTMSSHAGWTEVTAYSESSRPALTFGSASGGSVNNSANKAVYTVNADNTQIGGAFIVSNANKSSTSGVLYGGGAFAGGNKTLSNGDTLSVTVTCTATAG